MKRFFSVLLAVALVISIYGLAVAASPNNVVNYDQAVTGDLDGDNLISSTQTGTYNSVTGAQTSSGDALITPPYNANELNTTQTGDNNTAVINQGAYSTGADPTLNIATTTQSGSDNAITVNQTTNANTNTLDPSTQEGDNNEATITQTSSDEGTNTASFGQDSTGATDDAANILTSTQNATGDNDLNVTMTNDGDLDNTVDITQVGQAGADAASNSATDISISGSENEMDITQESDGDNIVYPAVQTGDNNDLDVAQRADDENSLETSQIGDGNIIDLTQRGGVVDTVCATTNYADLSQTGDDNSITIHQYSLANNTATVTQEP